MVNLSSRAAIALLAALAVVASAPGPARAMSDAVANAAAPQWLDQTIYRPNCPRVEYDEHCLFEGCAADCMRR